jgi:hypothetical protein
VGKPAETDEGRKAKAAARARIFERERRIVQSSRKSGY